MIRILEDRKSDIWSKNFIKALTLCLIKMCKEAPNSFEAPLPYAHGYTFKQNLIHLAASKGQTKVTMALMACTSAPNAPDEEGQTPIHFAAKNGHTDVIKSLAPNTVIPNAPDNRGQTPIHYAAKSGHSEVLRQLMKYTDNPNSLDDWNRTPIYFAAQNGHAEAVKILVTSTSNPNAPGLGGWTPIHFAAKNGHLEVIKVLVSYTKEPNAPDNDGITPSDLAVKNGYHEIAKILKYMISTGSTKKNKKWTTFTHKVRFSPSMQFKSFVVFENSIYYFLDAIHNKLFPQFQLSCEMLYDLVYTFGMK